MRRLAAELCERQRASEQAGVRARGPHALAKGERAPEPRPAVLRSLRRCTDGGSGEGPFICLNSGAY